MDHERKVLVVDDNEINCEILHELLDGLFAVRTAVTGQESLDVAEAYQPRVILLDVTLPDMDGYAVCRTLRSDARFAEVRIVMISARAMSHEREAGLDAGADYYITKPFDELDVLRLVSEAFETPTEDRDNVPQLIGSAGQFVEPRKLP